MSLIACPSCNRQISQPTARCPHCPPVARSAGRDRPLAAGRSASVRITGHRVAPSSEARHLLALVIVALLVASPALARAAEPGELCFAETGACIAGPFRAYWESHGGLPVFGFPITPARPERNRDTGTTYLTQWFERNRFELHGDQILLGRLGDDRLRQLGRDWRAQPPGAPAEGCDFFPETNHRLCDQATGLGFKTYWSTQGGLAFFGFPLTEARTETNPAGDTVLTQWFERARFEWHPHHPPQFQVLLGLLGREVGPPAGQPIPAPALTPSPAPRPSPTPTSAPASCHPAYPTVCIPPPPPDLDCKDISFRNFKVLPPDPHRFDGDRDGIGCET